MDKVLVVNKPPGMSSGNVVYKLRRVLKTKKIGHAGTLDPLASGVLVLGIDKATRILEYLMSETKEYVCEITIGYSTQTYDSLGAKVEEKAVLDNIQDIDKVLSSFLGKQKQIPPIYSAIKVDGKKLYDYALKNQEVDIPVKEIEIFEIERLTDILYENNLARFTFRVLCSKGTYIRSLCSDMGKELNYPAHMSNLIRTKSGDFSIKDSYTLEDIEMGKFNVVSISEALKNFNKLVIEDEIMYNKINNGVAIDNINNYNGLVLLVDKENKALAIYESENDILKAKKVLI